MCQNRLINHVFGQSGKVIAIRIGLEGLSIRQLQMDVYPDFSSKGMKICHDVGFGFNPRIGFFRQFNIPLREVKRIDMGGGRGNPYGLCASFNENILQLTQDFDAAAVGYSCHVASGNRGDVRLKAARLQRWKQNSGEKCLDSNRTIFHRIEKRLLDLTLEFEVFRACNKIRD